MFLEKKALFIIQTEAQKVMQFLLAVQQNKALILLNLAFMNALKTFIIPLCTHCCAVLPVDSFV